MKRKLFEEIFRESDGNYDSTEDPFYQEPEGLGPWDDDEEPEEFFSTERHKIYVEDPKENFKYCIPIVKEPNKDWRVFVSYKYDPKPDKIYYNKNKSYDEIKDYIRKDFEDKGYIVHEELNMKENKKIKKRLKENKGMKMTLRDLVDEGLISNEQLLIAFEKFLSIDEDKEFVERNGFNEDDEDIETIDDLVNIYGYDDFIVDAACQWLSNDEEQDLIRLNEFWDDDWYEKEDDDEDDDDELYESKKVKGRVKESLDDEWKAGQRSHIERCLRNYCSNNKDELGIISVDREENGFTVETKDGDTFEIVVKWKLN